MDWIPWCWSESRGIRGPVHYSLWFLQTEWRGSWSNPSCAQFPLLSVNLQHYLSYSGSVGCRVQGFWQPNTRYTSSCSGTWQHQSMTQALNNTTHLIRGAYDPPLQERRHHRHTGMLLVILKFARKKNKWEGLNFITEYANCYFVLSSCALSNFEVVQWHPQSSSIHSPSFLPSICISLPSSHTLSSSPPLFSTNWYRIRTLSVHVEQQTTSTPSSRSCSVIV